MKIPRPKPILEQLKLQVELDGQFQNLGTELQSILEWSKMIGLISQDTNPPQDINPLLEGATLRPGLAALIQQAIVLREAVETILSGTNQEETGQNNKDLPFSLARLTMGVASLERAVYSTGLLCQVLSVLLSLDNAADPKINTLQVAFFESSTRLQEIIDFFEQLRGQNPTIGIESVNYESFVKSLQEMQEKLEVFEGPELPDLPEYTTLFFAKRHSRSENTIRDHFENWTKRKSNSDKTKDFARWRITDRATAVAFDNYLWSNRRNPSSKVVNRKRRSTK